MSKKTLKIVYYVVTALFSAMMLMAAFMYFSNTEEVGQNFNNLGYPASLVIPLGIAKVLGVIAIWVGKPVILKNLAYLGYLINFVLALVAHLSAGDGEFGGPIMAIVLVSASYFLWKKAF